MARVSRISGISGRANYYCTVHSRAVVMVVEKIVFTSKFFEKVLKYEQVNRKQIRKHEKK